jgi:hypothetical protein
MGGVYNMVNLHLYHYAGNNPLKYTDPDGRDSGYVMDENAVGPFGHAGWFVKTNSGYSFFEVTGLPDDVTVGQSITREGETKSGMVLSNTKLVLSNWAIQKFFHKVTSAGVIQRDFASKGEMMEYFSSAGKNGGYDSLLEFNTTTKEDAAILKASFEKGSNFSFYALLGNSCGIIARDVLTTPGSGLYKMAPLGLGGTVILNSPNDIGDNLYNNNISRAKKYSVK